MFAAPSWGGLYTLVLLIPSLAACLALADEMWAEMMASFPSRRFKSRWAALTFVLCHETGNIPDGGRSLSLGPRGKWEINVCCVEPLKIRKDVFESLWFVNSASSSEIGPEPHVESLPLWLCHVAHCQVSSNFLGEMKKLITK